MLAQDIGEIFVGSCCGSLEGGFGLQVDVNKHFDKFDYSLMCWLDLLT
jgi:hypothetical protein